MRIYEAKTSQMKRNNLAVIILVISIVLILIFLIKRTSPQKLPIKGKAWNESIIESEQEYWKEHKLAFNTLNGKVIYSFIDSTKKKKTGVSIAGFNHDFWTLVINTDSVKLGKDSLLIGIFDVLGKKPIVKDVKVYLSNEKLKNKLINKKHTLGENGGQYTITPQKKGLNELNITVTTNDETFKKRFVFIAY